MVRADGEEILHHRTRVLYWVVVAVVAVFVGRLYFLQVVAGDRYRDHSQANSVKVRTLDAPRGIIHDHEGRVLVDNREARDLVVDKDRITDWAALARWVTQVTGEPTADLVKRLSAQAKEPGHRPLVLVRDLAFSQMAFVEARRDDVPGLSIETHVLRQYPHAEAAHVLGYVAEIGADELAKPEFATYHQPRDLVGKAGVERQYDRLLTGQRGTRNVIVNNFGHQISSAVITAPTRGADVHLTLDLDIQRAAERALTGWRGACVVLDVKTGAVLALASSPGYEANAFVGGISKVRWDQYKKDPKDPLRFRALAGTYPPGSAFKPIVAAAVLESGTHPTEYSVFCGGSVRVYNQTRHCWKEEGHGTVDMHEAMMNSCNVYYYLTAKDVGMPAIQRLAQEIGFGQLTGIDLPGERAGVLPSDSWKRSHVGEKWYPGDTINLGIGQGFLSVTPVQVAVFAMAVANGGAIFKPHVFSHAVDPRTGQVVERAPFWQMRNVHMEPATVRFLHSSMEDVVKRGTGRRASLPGIRVAGKTGTAQPSSGAAPTGMRREDRAERYQEHAWFMGFAPVEAPEVAVAVVIEHAGFHGGEVAAPVAHDVLEAYFDDRVQVAGQ